MKTNGLKVFYESLDIMAKGMMGIFIVILIIYFMIKLLLRVFPQEK